MPEMPLLIHYVPSQRQMCMVVIARPTGSITVSLTMLLLECNASMCTLLVSAKSCPALGICIRFHDSGAL